MQKHTNFWIGFFVAVLLIVPFLLSAWGLAQEHAKAMVTFLLGSLASAIILAMVFIFFREKILNKIVGTTKNTIEDISHEAMMAITAASSGDKEASIKHASILVGASVAWYSWSGFYRWVIGTCTALLVGFGAFTGTVLLFEQNKKLEIQSQQLIAQTKLLDDQKGQLVEQNTLASLNMVTNLRDRLRSVAKTRVDFEQADSIFKDSAFNKCDADFAELELDLPANPSEVEAIRQLAETGGVAEKLRQSLKVLLQDEDSAVKFAAFSILDQLSDVADGTEINLENLLIDRENMVSFETAVDLNFKNSVIKDFECSECNVNLHTSYFHGESKTSTIVQSSLYSPSKQSLLPLTLNETIFFSTANTNASYEFGLDDTDYKVLMVTQEIYESNSEDRYYFVGFDENRSTYCAMLNDFALNNSFIKFSEPLAKTITIRPPRIIRESP